MKHSDKKWQICDGSADWKIRNQHLLGLWLLITITIDFHMIGDLFLVVMHCQSQHLKLHVMNQHTSPITPAGSPTSSTLWPCPSVQPCPVPHHPSPLLPALFLLLTGEVWAKLANLFHD